MKKFLSVLLSLIVVIVSFPPVAFADSTTADFDSALIDMLEEYDVDFDEEKSNQFQSMRLAVQTVNASRLYSTYGAIEKINNGRGYYVLQYKTEAATRLAYEKLNNSSNVEYAVCDEVVKISAMSDRRGAKTIQSDRYKKYLSDNGKDNKVIVAVLDTGCNTSHAMLKNRVVKGYNPYSKDSTVTDKNGHGSHVAGIVADNTPNNVKIMPIKVFKNDGSATTLGIKYGIEYAVKHGAKVINMSLGGTCTDQNCPMATAVRNAISKGVTVVNAAGNDTRNTSQYCPSNISECIVVASTEANGSSISTYSNYGATVDLAAPGENIQSCSKSGNGYVFMSGTSMAAPFVAAAAALVLTKNTSYKPAKVEEILKSYCCDMLVKGWDKYSGNGILNFGIPLGDNENANHIGMSISKNVSFEYFSKCSPYLNSINTSFDGYDNVHPLTDRSFTATTTNKAVAYFDGRYIVPKGKGSCKITLSLANGKSVSCNVNVKNVEVWTDYAASSYAGGKGTKSSPYLIKTAQQLAKFAKDLRNGKSFYGKYFKLMNDIDLKGKLWISAVCYKKSGDYFSQVFNEDDFQGTFDGNNHKIKNMHVFDLKLNSSWGDGSPINANWYNNYGFLGGINGATIKNLGIDNAYVTNKDSGILFSTSYSSSTISNCYTSGFTTGSGIAGAFNNFDNVMSNCYSSATVAKAGIASRIYSSMAGGKVRLNNVFFCGEQLDNEENSKRGAFAISIEANKGYNYTELYNCFETAKTTSSIGFAGSVLYSKLYNCYYSSKNSKGYSVNKGSKINLSKKSDSFFKSKSNYTNSKYWNSKYKWDFKNTWAISSSVNNGYPYLKKNKPSSSSNLVKTNTWLDYAAKSFAGGSGTKDNPYLISTPEQLARISYLYRFGGGRNTYFKLTKNIDLSSHYWYPIGAGLDMNSADNSSLSFYHFMGNIDGNGKSISGLKVKSKGNNAGFIAMQFNGSIKNITFKDVSINGGYSTAAICSNMSGCSYILNCKVNGSVKGTEYVGGLAEKIGANARIIGSSFNGSITANENAGGVACESIGLVDRCSFTGSIDAEYYAGVVNINWARIYNCYANVPNLDCDITIDYDRGELKNCYIISNNSTLIENCLHNSKAIKLNDSDISNKDVFSSFDFDKTWSMTSSKPVLNKVTTCSIKTYPTSKWTAATKFAGGNGTKDKPYLISNAEQLALLRDKYYLYDGKHFKLTKSIDLGGKVWDSVYDGLLSVIKVYFDGNNKTISNVVFKDSNGLFPFALAEGGTIKNLNIKNATGRTVAGIVSSNFGTISKCSVTGNFTNAFDVYWATESSCAGIVGDNYGTVSKCSVNATINTSDSGGGIATLNCGKISNCYSAGTMLQGDCIVGNNRYYDGGTITNCYTTAKQIASNSTTVSEGGISNVYYLGGATGIFINNNNCFSKADMLKKETYKGFNFDSIWKFNENSYPTLR